MCDAIFGLRMSEEEEILGADFVEHNIKNCIKTVGEHQNRKETGTQCPPNLQDLTDTKSNRDRRVSSNYCGQGILNFGYLAINETVTTQEIKKIGTEDAESINVIMY